MKINGYDAQEINDFSGSSSIGPLIISPGALGKKCPGCGGRRGEGPDGCCRKCWQDPPKKRKHLSSEVEETQ